MEARHLKSPQEDGADRLCADLQKMKEKLWRARGRKPCPRCGGDGSVPGMKGTNSLRRRVVMRSLRRLPSDLKPIAWGIRLSWFGLKGSLRAIWMAILVDAPRP